MNPVVIALLLLLLLCIGLGLYLRRIVHLCVQMFREPPEDGADSQDSAT